jgi:hypothetical protein
MLLIFVAVALVIFQAYVLLNHSAYWTDHPERDIPLHFMWGLIVFLFVVDILDWRVRDALLAVLVVAFMFEACEMTSEKLTRGPDDFYDHFYWDGFTDNIVNFIGGLAGSLLLFLVKPWPKTISPLQQHFIVFLIAMIPMCAIGAYLARGGESPDLFVIIWTFVTAALVVVFCRPRFDLWVRGLFRS